MSFTYIVVPGGTDQFDPLWTGINANFANIMQQSPVLTVTNAQVLTLHSAPLLVLPAQGAGTLIQIDSMVIENVNGGTAYASGGTIQLSYGAAATYPASATIASTFLTSPTVTQAISVAGALATTATSNIVNVGVYLYVGTADFTTGTGTLQTRIQYRVHTGF